MLFLIPFAMLSIAFVLYGLYSLRTYFWRPTRGELKKLKIVLCGVNDEGYELEVKYRYQDPKGHTHTNQTLWTGFKISLSSRASWGRTHHRLFKNRRRLTVYHHPKNPERSVLFRGMHPLGVVVYLLFNSLFLAGWVLHRTGTG